MIAIKNKFLCLVTVIRFQNFRSTKTNIVDRTEGIGTEGWDTNNDGSPLILRRYTRKERVKFLGDESRKNY